MTLEKTKWLNWGILGTGKIARKFAAGISQSRYGRLAAIASRSAAKAAEFAAAFSAERSYGSYDDLLLDDGVDAVYISLPNHRHAAWTANTARSGKHILCEKPFTVNLTEAEDALKAVEEARVFFMEAFMYRCHPQTRALRGLLDQRVVGDIRLIQSSFCYNMGRHFDNIRLSNPAAGGAIMDIGCYTASLARLAHAVEPVVVQGAAHIGPVSRVDEVSAATLRWPGGTIASLVCATQVAAPHEARFFGESGSIIVPNPWFPIEGDNVIIVNRPGVAAEEVHSPASAPLYALEADHVAQCIEEHALQSPAMPWADTLGNMAVLDAWRKCVGLTFDCE